MREALPNWPTKRVDEVCDLGRGRVISQEEIRRHSGVYPVFSSQSKDEGVFGFLNTYDFEGDYVTWTTDGANAGTVFFRMGRFNCTNVCGTLKPKSSGTSARFLARALSTVTKRHVSYVGNPKLMNNVMAAIQLRMPSKPEQDFIAAVLDTVDEAIAKTEAVIAKLKQVRAGLLHDLLTRGLDEHGHLRDPIAHPEQFQDSPLGRIPREWRWSKFEDVLAGIEAGKSPDYPDYPAPPGEWGVLKVSAIWPEGFRPYENKWVTKAMHQNPAYEVHDGDLLISRSNTYELVGIVSLVRDTPPRLMLCDKTLRLRLKPDRGLNPFFALMLQTPTARSQIEINATGTSGSMKNISQGVIRGLVFAYPDVEEQHRILTVMAPMDQELEVLGHELGKLLALKSGLMTDLLTGRVRVPEHSGMRRHDAALSSRAHEPASGPLRPETAHESGDTSSHSKAHESGDTSPHSKGDAP